MSTLSMFLVLISILTVVESACYVYSRGPNDNSDCELDNVIIPIDTTKQVGCKTCSCFRGGLSCCDIGGRMFLPPYCKTVSDGPCKKKAVMRNNPSVPCDVVGETGR